jgi:hypothetical protein
MLIIIDARSPQTAQKKLSELGTVFPLETSGIVYESINGHPDIFLFQSDRLVIVAPNAPKALFDVLKTHDITYLKGREKLDFAYPATAWYNAVGTAKFLIHRLGYSSECIKRHHEFKKFLHVPQGYTRCNLLALPDGSFITSDRGIEKSLLQYQLEVHFFSPDKVVLSGQKHGFLPGACGLYRDKLYLMGSLDFYTEGERFRTLMNRKTIEIIELYQGVLMDTGGIFFLEC